ncbi:MAG: UTP--glucose-phosphate uridylyltransferase [Solirubrobacteraceae bacterium]|jgi:UTP--glucose-1-phosphate uridylyltransferase|nr:UTP--glucose-phosphate uridylyltransferase [Solirubrobacteraceae bacterium]
MDGLRACVEKMEREGVPRAAVDTFRHYYEQLREGETGMLPESEIEPVEDVQDLDELPEGTGAPLDRAIVLKLNGGLGTSMGMTRAKSLIEAKDGLSFLDVIARQVLELRERTGARLPLVLMNSFYTREDSLQALEAHPDLASDVPADFVQNKEPKVLVDGLAPAEWPPEPALEWCPPGHGDLYTALLTSGMLGALLEAGYRWAFMSNSDNLGAVLDPRILAWIAREEIPFAMEVTDRTEADRKGGHIARRPGGGYLLRETAQTPEEDLDALQDISRHRYVNTNNLWLDLEALKRVMAERDGVLGLPLIVNRKTVDPGDKSTPEVFQLETAMGAAIGVFDGARPVRVPRGRFSPVKTTEDLLALRSDAYELADDARVVLADSRDGTPPVVDLDDEFYKKLADFDERFSQGAPSLVDCERIAVEGDVRFGRGVVARGRVRVQGPKAIEDGAVLGG